MPNTSTTVTKGKDRPARFTWFGSDGVTPVTGGTVPLGPSNASIANVSIDPNNPRRALIRGMNVGTSTVTIGSGPNALVINVTVSAPPDQTHFELDGFDPEE